MYWDSILHEIVQYEKLNEQFNFQHRLNVDENFITSLFDALFKVLHYLYTKTELGKFTKEQ